LGGVVFIDAVEADEGVEDEQDRLVVLDGVPKALAICRCIQAQGGSGNHLDREGFKGDLGGGGDAGQALTHDGQGVFGWEEQHGAGAADGEVAQARGAGGDAHGDIQSQEALTAFGFAAEDADGLVGPEALDQPLGLGTGASQLTGTLDGKFGVHALRAGLGSSAKTSKKSF